MESPMHDLSTLFDQLGLDHQDEAIDNFIAKHKPVPGHIELHEAECWTPSQAAFLKQMKDEDADWVGVIDQLDVLLR